MENKDVTTGEIVRTLRYCGSDETKCAECEYTCIDQSGECFMQLSKVAADRLESQEREIERLNGEMFANALDSAERIAALTARAEQAEARETAAVANINLCMDGDICKACVSWKNGICSRKDNRCDPKYRGLQQKNGEEK